MSRGISNLGGGGGLTQEEHDALMSIASMPARGDVNPTKDLDNFKIFSTNGTSSDLVVDGYDTLSLYKYSTSGSGTCSWIKRDGTSEALTVTVGSWNDIAIPSDAQILRLVTSSGTSLTLRYALFTTDSPYNPL